jgi:hypothetical protein
MIRALLSDDQARKLLEIAQDRMLEMALEQRNSSPGGFREKAIIAAAIVRLEEALRSAEQMTR